MIDLLITVLVVLILFALIAYVLNTFVPLDPPLRQVLQLILAVVFLLWLLSVLLGHSGVWRLGGPLR